MSNILSTSLCLDTEVMAVHQTGRAPARRNTVIPNSPFCSRDGKDSCCCYHGEVAQV